MYLVLSNEGIFKYKDLKKGGNTERMGNKTMKKILTIEDLVQFCQTQNFHKFSSTETGYQLSVQVPAIATYKKEEVKDDTLLFCKVKLFHIGRNRNGSSVTKEAAEKALSTIAYKPLLANFCEIDGVKDFTSHDMNILEDGSIEYIERQIGTFTADKPYIEYDKENDKDFIYAYVAIPREYSDASEIIERKEGTKVSVELIINAMSYNATERVLELEDIIVQGATCLGKNPETGEDVGEGMKGARLDIVDFSVENNSVQFNTNEELLNEIKKLNENLSHININPKLEEGGNETVNKFEELLEKYGKTVEDITFEYENLSDEELEAKFAAEFGEDDTDGEGEADPEPTSEGDKGEDNSGDNGDDNGNAEDGEISVEDGQMAAEDNSSEENPEGNDNLETDSETEPEVKPEEDPVVVNESIKPEKYSVAMSDGTVKEFALTLDEINNALYMLVNDTYGEADNAWYSVQVYEDGSLIMLDWWNNKAYKQSYKREEDNFSLVGDRVAVKQIWVTDEEETALNEMKANYSSISEKLSRYQKAEIDAQKSEIISDEAYVEFAETDEFKEIAKNIENYSVDELKTACELAFAKCVKKNGTFSLKVKEEETKKKVNKIGINANFEKDDNEPYGDYFKSIKTY